MTTAVEKVDTSKHDNRESESTLSFFAKLGYGLGHVYNDFAATVWFSYLLLFFKDVMLMPQEAGPFMVLGQFVDAGFSAIVGFLTDCYSTKRNWHIMGSIIVTLSFPVIFVLQQDVLPYWEIIIYFSVCIILFQCGWATVQISHLAILPELSKTHGDRSELNSMRYCMSVFANITVFVVTWTVLHLHDQGSDHIGPADFSKFRNIALLLTVAGVIATIIFQVSISLNKYSPNRTQKSCTEIEVLEKPVKVKVSTVLKNPELYQIALLYAFSRLFLVVATIYIPLWLNEFMKTKSNQNVENIALVPLVFYVSSLISAFLLKYINQHVSHKIVYCAGSVISILGCAWISLSDEFEATELFEIASLLGAGSSVTQISSLCITSDLIGDKSEHGGLIYSIITVCDKLFSGIIVFVIETLESGQNHYTDVLIFNGVTALLGLLVLGTFRRKTQ